MGMSSVTVSSLTTDVLSGLDAMEKVLRKAKKEGTKAFGHSYSKSLDGDATAH